jgi:hypothetical protein
MGLAVAAAVIGGWGLLFRHAMWGISLAPGAGRSPWWDIVGTFFALEFASAGLFITTHGAAAGARRGRGAAGGWRRRFPAGRSSVCADAIAALPHPHLQTRCTAPCASARGG